ncbi:MAG TPA: HlyD family efflux transporter periplasmic adaptor subunit [Terriglobales bacterium]|nr:HlyD family efflux transporter periplasmic adaptor subunit [Terriglobales bacterium]
MTLRILDRRFRRDGKKLPRLGPRARRGLLAAAVLVVAAALSLALLPSRKGEPASGGAGDPRVTRGSFRSTIVLTGSLTALRSEEFKVPITENYRVQIKWMVKEGDAVKPGDPVVRFDTASLASSIETAQDALKAKWEEKAQKEAEYENQKFELDVEVKKAENDNRQKSLDASIPPGLEARYEYDRKQLEKRISDNALEAARRNRAVKRAELESQIKALTIEVGELEAKLKKAKDSLNGLTLVAGTEGAVIYAVDDWSGRKVQVGDTVFATDSVAKIPDLRSLIVQAWVSETHIQRIKAGQSVDMALDAYPDRPYKGAIRQISKSADPVRRWGKSSYFRVDIGLDRLEPEVMKPGMSVRCEVRGPEYADVLLVPLEKAAFDGESFWVRPAGGGPLKLAALDYDEFAVAAAAKDNPGLKPDQVLAAVGPVPKAAAEAKPAEKKVDEKK